MTKIVWLSVALFFIIANFQAKAQQPDHERESLSKAQTIFVDCQSQFVKQAEVENALREQPEFKKWKLEIVTRPQLADLVVEVHRTPFTTNFPFRVLDTVANRVVMSGEVSSLFGTVSGRLARSMMKQMKKYRPDSPSDAKPAEPERRDN
jgi:hypothetical protein